MTDSYDDSEKQQSRVVFAVFAGAIIVAIFFAYRWSGSTPIRLTGVVQSMGTIETPRSLGGTQAVASVRLNDGTLVEAYVASDEPLSAGNAVQILQKPSLLGGSTYLVVSRAPSHEP